MMKHVYNVFHAFPAPKPEIVITSCSEKRGNTFTFKESYLCVLSPLRMHVHSKVITIIAEHSNIIVVCVKPKVCTCSVGLFSRLSKKIK